MILAIDIGNTNMEFGLFKDSKLINNFRLVTDRNTTSDEIGLMMLQFFAVRGIDISDIYDVIVASVVPQVMFAMNNAVKKYIKKIPIIVGEDCDVPIKNNYKIKKEVGIDRLVNAFCAYKIYSRPLIVVDFGTATTFDVVSEDGCYEGGCIFPGIKISMEALNRYAAKLPRVEISEPEVIIGKDTVTSMQSGAICGFVGATIYTISCLKKELGCDAYVVATGGLSGLIARHTDSINAVNKALSLQGLNDICVMFRQNKKL